MGRSLRAVGVAMVIVVAELFGTTSQQHIGLVRHLDLRYDLPSYATREEWQRRVEPLRLQVILSCGLFPPLPRSPLQPKRVICYRDEGVTVERVALETLPKFYLTGNLYRPARGKGPFPAVLHPHGHVPQDQGRLYERERVRAVSLARLGFVVFAYDMVGYGDQFQVDHRAPETPYEHLWGLSKGALQTWNSLRALDFLLSLREVDGRRIGCCGSSGGGTQTYLIASVDERVAVAVPTKMVSAHMQGGCICENPPLLRLDTSNPEICGLIAPRPILLISDDGDWTNETPTYEFPFLKSIYRLLNAEDRCANAHFSEGHEFGRESRTAYYRFALRWLAGLPEETAAQVEEPQGPIPDEKPLRVWGPDLPKPAGAASYTDVLQWIRRQSQRYLSQAIPRDQVELRRFRRTFGPYFQTVLTVPFSPPREMKDEVLQERQMEGQTVRKVRVNGSSPWGAGEVVLAESLDRRKEVVLLVRETDAGSALWNGVGEEAALAAQLIKRCAVGAVSWIENLPSEDNAKIAFFTTYNRTRAAQRVCQVALIYLWLSRRYREVHLVGVGEGGLIVLLASSVLPYKGKVVAELAQFDPEDDREFVRRLYLPLIRRVGDVKTAAALIAGRPLFVHNWHDSFPIGLVRRLYSIQGTEERLTVQKRAATVDKIARWLFD